MAAGGGEDVMSDELVSNKCCVCVKKSKITEADKYCVECSNYYCTLCADIHTIVPLMEGHKLLDKSAFKSLGSGGTLPSFPTQRCSIHPSKVVDMYCQGHDEVACASCIALDHRSCALILSVPENVDNLYKRSEVINMKQNIASNQKSLLLADANNNKLKRVDLSTETVTDHLSLISSPQAVCQISKTEAAVSLNNNTVQFVTLGDKLTATRTLKFNHNCEDLVLINGKLFISNRSTSVYIHDMVGKELRKITTDASGKDIFTKTRHIVVSADGSRVFVADYNNGLMTLDIQGNYLSSLSESKIQAKGCFGVCTDGSNVFVCGLSSNIVVQIGQDHKLIGQIQRVSKPNSLCYSSQTSRL